MTSQTTRIGSVWKSLAWLLGTAATVIAGTIAAVLAMMFAATVVVIAVVSTVLFGVVALALRARRTAKASPDDGIIEARNIGGHSWVAYGRDERKF